MLSPARDLKPYQEKVGEIMEEELLKLEAAQDIRGRKSRIPTSRATKSISRTARVTIWVWTCTTWATPGAGRPGMVFTIEPGLYIHEEGIGVRLENDVLITKNGEVDLMKNIPIEAEEIEDLSGTGRYAAELRSAVV